jgi:hypothetical protein
VRVRIPIVGSRQQGALVSDLPLLGSLVVADASQVGRIEIAALQIAREPMDDAGTGAAPSAAFKGTSFETAPVRWDLSTILARQRHPRIGTYETPNSVKNPIIRDDNGGIEDFKASLLSGFGGWSSIWKKHSKCEAALSAEFSATTNHIGLPHLGQAGLGSMEFSRRFHRA